MSDLLSAASLLLAVVSVVYGLWYPEIIRTIDLPVPKYAEDRKRPFKEISNVLFRRSIPLAAAAAIVAAVFLPDAIRIALLSSKGYYDMGLDALQRYNSVATAFFIVELFAGALAAHTVGLVAKLIKRRRQLACPT